MTEMLLDPIRLVSLALFAPFVARSIYRRWQLKRDKAAISERLGRLFP
jgi:hypothetical protein